MGTLGREDGQRSVIDDIPPPSQARSIIDDIPPPPPPRDATFGDVIKSPLRGALIGTGSLLQAPAELIAQALNASTGSTLRTVNPGQALADAVIPLSRGGQMARAESLPTGDITKPETLRLPERPTLGGLAVNVGEGAGQLVGPGSILGRAGATLASRAAGAGLKQVATAAPAATEIAGFTGMSMAQQAEQVREALADPKMQDALRQSQSYRDSVARGASDGDALDQAIAVAARGAFLGGAPAGSAEGLLAHLVMSRLKTPVKTVPASALGRVGKATKATVAGAASEGLQEVGEDVGGALGANIALGGQVLDPTANTAQSFAGGALAGGPIGAVAHIARPVATPNEPPPNEPPAGPISRAATVAKASVVAAAPSVEQGPQSVTQPDAERSQSFDSLDTSLVSIAARLSDPQLLTELRKDERFGNQSVSDLLYSWGIARNPNIDSSTRARAANGILEFINTFDQRPNFVNRPDGPGTAVALSGGPLERTEAGGQQVAPFQAGRTIDGESSLVTDQVALPRQALGGPTRKLLPLTQTAAAQRVAQMRLLGKPAQVVPHPSVPNKFAVVPFHKGNINEVKQVSEQRGSGQGSNVGTGGRNSGDNTSLETNGRRDSGDAGTPARGNEPPVPVGVAGGPKRALKQKRPSRSIDLLGAIRRRGGISSSFVLDLSGEDMKEANRRWPFLFRKRGRQLDELASVLAHEDRFDIDVYTDKDNGGINQLSEMIRRALSGERVVPIGGVEQDLQAEADEIHRDTVKRKAKRFDVKTRSRNFTDVEQDVLRIERQRHERAVELLDERSARAYDAAYDALSLLIGGEEADSTTEQERNRELPVRDQIRSATRTMRERIARIKEWRESNQDEELDAIFGPSATKDGPSEASARQTLSGRAGEGVEPGVGKTGAGESREPLRLEQQTERELAEKAEREKAASEEKGAITKEQADKELAAVPFSLTQQSQPKASAVTGGQGGFFTPDGRVSEVAQTQPVLGPAEPTDADAHEAASSPRNDKPESTADQLDTRTDQTASGQQATPYTLSEHLSLRKRLATGEVKVGEFKLAYAQMKASKDAIAAELRKMTKAQLIEAGLVPPFRKSDPKDAVVRLAVSGLRDVFDLRETQTYVMGQFDETVDRLVEEATQQTLDDYAARRKKAREKRAARIAEANEKINDPKTLEDFRLLVRVKGDAALTPEQRRRFEDLQAEDAISARKKQQESGASVRAPSQAVQAEIVATKHTKHGYVLFVVKPAERVEREVYSEWSAAAKKLGGWYSSFSGAGAVPGFQFKTRESAEAFRSLISEGNTQAADSASDELRAARTEAKTERKTSKLREMADMLSENANESLNKDRLTNTAKRARQASSAEAEARAQLQLAETMRNLAAAVESGEATHLAQIRTKAQVQMLTNMLSSAKRKELLARYDSYSEQEKHSGDPPTPETADYATFPKITSGARALFGAARVLRESRLTGVKLLADRLTKLAEAAGENDRPMDISLVKSVLKKMSGNAKERDLPWDWAETVQRIKRLEAAGITNVAMLRAALREFVTYSGKQPERDTAKELERKIVGSKVGVDFFPTPTKVAQRMVASADIDQGMRVLEPSAGNGNIAEAVRAAGVDPDVVEVSAALREILEAKGFNIVGRDFMDVENGGYDRIVMNPPFSKGRDIEHVRHAYDLLKPGGRLVAIMGDGAFSRNDSQAAGFRSWLESVGGVSEKLPDGTFNDKTLLATTGTNARIVEIDKSGDDTEASFSRHPGLLALRHDPLGQRPKPIPESTLRSVVADLTGKWENAPPIEIVSSLDDQRVPDSVREEIARQGAQGAQGDVSAFWHKGRVFLVADSISSRAHAIELVMHETLGHQGLKGVFGKDLEKVLRRIATVRVTEMRAKAREYGLDLDKDTDRLYAAEEVLADMAQTYPEIGFVKQAIAAIKSFLRRIGLLRADRMSNDEIIREYILPARRFVERGRTDPRRGDDGANVDTQFSRSILLDSGVRVLRNPTREQAKNLAGRSEFDELRGLTDTATGDVYVWDSGQGVHSEVANELGLSSPERFSMLTGDISGAPDGTFSGESGFREFRGRKGRGGVQVEEVPMFARSTSSRVLRQSREIFADLTTTAKGFNWRDKTFHTQLHKARKHAGFARVFDLTQQFIDTISATALRASELAPDVLPDITRPGVAWKGLIKGRQAAKDIDSIADVLFSDNLKDPASHEFTDEELAAKGKTQDQIRVYRQVRAAVRESLDHYAAAEAWRMTQNVTRSVRDQVMQSPRNARAVIGDALDAEIAYRLEQEEVAREKFKEDRALVEQWKKTALESADSDKERSDIERQAESRISKATEPLDRAVREKEKAKDLKRSAMEIFDRSDQLKQRGYMPRMRFGRYTVDAIVPETRPDGSVVLDKRGRPVPATDENGEPVRLFFSMYDSEAAANQAARRLGAVYQGQEVIIVRGLVSEEDYKQFKGVSPETVAMFADIIGRHAPNDEAAAALKEARDEYIRLATSNRSAMRRMLKRKDIAGYSNDVSRVLSSFLTSNGRAAATAYWSGDMDKAVDVINEADVRDDARKLANYARNPDDDSHGIRSLMFFMFIGGSPAAAIVNMTQPVMMTFPALAQFGGAAKAARLISRAALDYVGRKQKGYDEDLQNAIKRAERAGIVSPQEIHHLYNESIRNGVINRLPTNFAYRAKSALTLWGFVFSAAESVNRHLSFVAAYRMAKEDAKLGDPYDFAVRITDETQGIYNPANRPNWSRGIAGAAAFTFRQYSIAYLELLKRMWKSGPEGKRAAGLMLGMLVLASGLQGVGGDDIDDLVDTVGQFFGFGTNFARTKRKWAADLLGKEFGNFAMYGASAYLPIDIQSRLGLNNILPATGLLKRSEENKAGQVLEIFGPPGSVAKAALEGFDAAAQGRYGDTAIALMPKAVRDGFKAADMLATGTYRDSKGYKVADVDSADAFWKAIGLHPASIGFRQRATSTVRQDIALVRDVQDGILRRWVNGILTNDREAVQAARSDLKDWNRRNPKLRIAVTPRQLQTRIRAARTEQSDRLLKTAPRTIRAGLSEDFE